MYERGGGTQDEYVFILCTAASLVLATAAAVFAAR
jgi:hypothetical protein